VDLGQDYIDKIEHFFTHYKDLDDGKWVKVEGWEDLEAARKEITDSIARYQDRSAVA
jgi:inorganic pyrophosphatase